MSQTTHPYLAALVQSTQVTDLRLRTSDVALERCRQAVEWQSAVYEQVRVLTETARAPLSLPPPDAVTVNPDSAAQWLALAAEAKHLLHEAQITSGALGEQLKSLSDAVARVEQLTLKLAHHNEHMHHLCQGMRAASQACA